MRVLTAAPHIAGSLEDKKTAEFVAQKFREAGLETEIVEYKVWINYPSEISVDVVAPPGVKMHGPGREHVSSDPYQDDPRIVTPYSGFSPSGDVEAEVIYANYGRLEDFQRLQQMKIDVRGKIVIVRYGTNYRGVKAYLAQQFGAAGLLIYSDPLEDGYFKGDPYPKGPWRPATGVQRGSIGYSFNIPGDPTTPGIASVSGLPLSQRTPPSRAEMPKVPTTPLSWADAEPILKHLAGPESPRGWQGALPFTYHLGPGPVRVRMHLKQDYAYRSIWDVIGRVHGSVYPDEWVLAGNHRDAWVYGAVDPGSGTVAMLEAVRGIGRMLKAGWRPKRTLIFGSWDAEEHGLMGSTEWAEQHAAELDRAVAYLNLDSAVSGPNFGASAVPSLKQFMRDVAKAVPSPKGGTCTRLGVSAAKTRRNPMSPTPGACRWCSSMPMFPWETWAAGPTTRPSCNTWGFPPPTWRRAEATGSITPPSTISPGSSALPIPISPTSRRWRGCSAWRCCASPTATCFLTTTRTTARRSRPTFAPLRGGRRRRSASLPRSPRR